MKASIKKAIKEILGAKNAWKIALIRAEAKRSTFRFLRKMSGAKDDFPEIQTRTFKLPCAHVFFGYYDVPQFSRDENLLLATAAPLINVTPTSSDHLRIGFFDLREEKPMFQEFGTTSTWCWQQGCRLQWYPYSSQQTVIYNDLVGERYRCIVREVQTGKLVKSLPRPIYAVSRDGKWGLSLDFSRLQRLRPGYGYNNLTDESAGITAPFSDGIWRIDMESGEEKMLFSIRDIAEIKIQNQVAGEQHYFNHILFNMVGDRFMFFHICELPNGKRKIRLFTSSIDGSDIHLLNDSGHTSHYCWKNNEHLLCYCTVAGKGEGYFLFDDLSGESQYVGASILREDGHPTYLPDGQRLITDTYPDRYGELSLLLYDSISDGLTILHKEFLPLKFNEETRCDFHPRISHMGTKVCIDCIVDDKRVMKLFDIPAIAPGQP